MAIKNLFALAPDVEVVLTLEPEELAFVLLAHLQSLPPGEGSLNRHNFFHNPSERFADYPNDARSAVGMAFLSAWMWLERELMLIPRIGVGSPDWVQISKRGQRMVSTEDFDAYRSAAMLPRQLLHPAIAADVWSSFVRGKYETAVFQAFREVEISVRRAAGLGAEDYGTPLMRKAFDKTTGRLRDESATEAERESVAHLFAGAIGALKNPTSHRRLSWNDPAQAVEMIMLANLLLRIVDGRT